MDYNARYYYRCLVFSSCQDTLMVNSCGSVAAPINCFCLVSQAASIVFKSRVIVWSFVFGQGKKPIISYVARAATSPNSGMGNAFAIVL